MSPCVAYPAYYDEHMMCIVFDVMDLALCIVELNHDIVSPHPPRSLGDDDDGKRQFTDKDVCKPFFLGICINSLFTNTVSQ